MISSAMSYTKKRKVIDGKSIAYVDVGQGSPIILLHGNPTSSYLWRNVIPHLEAKGRVIAPDLIGHGDSEKLPADQGPERYSFMAAYYYLNLLLEELGITTHAVSYTHLTLPTKA